MSEPSASIRANYLARRERFAAELAALTFRWNRIANLRLAAFLLAAGFAVWAIRIDARWPLGVAAVALAGFVALVVVHRRLGAARRRAAILRDLNDEADKRSRREWAALPVRHTFRTGADHPFAGDLDLFGRASLFHLLETVATAMGERALREWLLVPAEPGAIGARQAAVKELAPALDWRQELETRGRLAGEERVDPEPFLLWAESPPAPANRGWLVWLARASAAAFLISAALDLLGYGPPVWAALLAVNLVISQGLGRGANDSISTAASHHRSLIGYAGVLSHLAERHPASPLLTALHERMSAGGQPAPEQVRRLHRLTAWAVPKSSLGYLPLQAMICLDIHVLDALERWKAVSGARVRDWLTAIGETEALAALAGLAHDQPSWTFPLVDPAADAFAATALGHPLLADEARIANDVAIGPPGSFLLITGSNMSGKSTLLRAVGVNIVLAGAGGPVCADRLTMPPVSLWTSARVQDSLERGVSFFMAELLRLKQIVDAARAWTPGEPRRCFLLDEILQGTNTAERQIAARRIIRGLVDYGAIGAVTSHDLGLAEGPELAAFARLAHFRDTVAESDAGPVMGFDYTLRPGLATSTNALRLMDLVGFDLPPLPGHSHDQGDRGAG